MFEPETLKEDALGLIIVKGEWNSVKETTCSGRTPKFGQQIIADCEGLHSAEILVKVE